MIKYSPYLIYLFLILFVNFYQFSCQQRKCPSGWVINENFSYCYRVGVANQAKSWQKAREACRSYGGDLLSIENADDKKIIEDFVNLQFVLLQKPFWIGGYLRENDNTWLWADSNKYITTDQIVWDIGKPDENGGGCLQISKNGSFSNEQCDTQKPYLCKRNFGESIQCDEDSWESIDGTCIQLSITTLTYDDSRIYCENRGGDLVTVKSDGVQIFLEDWVKLFNKPFWIGLSDKVTGELQWVNGDKLSTIEEENHWGPGEPSFIVNSGNKAGNCTVINGVNSAYWNIEDCDSENFFFCERRVGKCPDGWIAYRDKCYLVNADRQKYTSWPEAKRICSAYGANLLTINNNLEQIFIERQLKDSTSSHDFWLGLSNFQPVKYRYQWVLGNDVENYTNWFAGQPQTEPARDNCGLISSTTGNWYTTSNCYYTLPYVCEIAIGKEIIENPSDIGTYGGNDDGKPCIFPFKYKNSTYYQCINLYLDNYWCSTSGDYDTNQKWSYCQFTGSCEIGWEQTENVCYRIYDDQASLTYAQAQTKCNSAGGDAKLAAIKSSKSQTLINRMVGENSDDHWIGLSYSNSKSSWTWSDESLLMNDSFSNWRLNHPNTSTDGSCAIIDSTALYKGEWMSTGCESTKKKFVCSKPATNLVVPTPPATTTPSAKCGANWLERPISDSCYYFSNSLASFANAVKNCKEMNGNLLSISDVNEQVYLQGVLANMNDGKNYLIGANRESLRVGWKWSDGVTPFVFINWGLGNFNTGPNQYCAVMRPSGQWQTVVCGDDLINNQYNYICEKHVGDSAGTTTRQQLTTKPGYEYGCAQGWHYFAPTNQCFKYHSALSENGGKSFEESKQSCIQENGYLADVFSQDENEFLISILRSFKNQERINVCSNLVSAETGAGGDCIPKEACPTNQIISGFFCNEFDDPNIICCLNTTAVRESVWLGMYDELSGFSQVSFKWISGNEPTYTNWSPNQPVSNAGCVAFHAKDFITEPFYVGQWWVTPCDQKNDYFCKKRADLVMATSGIDDAGCPKGFNSYERRCFKFEKTSLTWKDAEINCQQYGGSLASINDKFEQSWLHFFQSSVDSMKWIGLKRADDKNSFKWSNNDALSYTNWDRNKPDQSDEDCVIMNENGFWQNYNCDAERSSICVTANSNYPTTTTTTTTTPAPLPCPSGWTDSQNKCYKFFSTSNLADRKNWYDAENYCKNLGGHLSSFDSLTSLSRVVNDQRLFTLPFQEIWIGLNELDSNQGYQWIDNSPTNFVYWDFGYPKTLNDIEECVELRNNQRWRNSFCYLNKAWSCTIEKGIDPNNTIIDVTLDKFNVTLCSDNNDNLNWTLYNNKCYYVSKPTDDQRVNWFEARKFCQNIGGDLLSIHSRKELEYTTAIVGKQLSQWWTGLNQLNVAFGFVWSDGSPLNYLNWAPGEPNDAHGGEKCVEMYGYNSYWNDANCAYRNGFVCERPENVSNFQPAIPETVLPLSFNNGNEEPCPPGFSTYGVVTTDANGTQAPCVFPFKYNGKLYYECVTFENRNPWCSTTFDYQQDKKWGYCADLKCFKLFDEKRIFSEARKKCLSEDASLASVHNEFEQSYLTALLRNSYNDYWLGLWAPDGRTFYYEDNSEFKFANWMLNKPSITPNDNCVVISSNKSTPGGWRNTNCNTGTSFVCSKYANGVKFASGCEYTYLFQNLTQNVQLSCKDDLKIAIVQADYGRDQYSMSCDDEYYLGSTCSSKDSTSQIVRDLCNEKQSCEITIDENTFEDPCPFVHKQLKVWYQCVNLPIKTTGGNSNNKTCVFPFKYNNVSHYQCTYETHSSFNNKKWCCTTSDCDASFEWGECPETNTPANTKKCDKEGYTSFDNGTNCYKLFAESKSWRDAKDFCERNEGGQLVSIRDGFEQGYIRLISSLSTNLNSWIGLTKNGSETNEYYWSDNWPVDYTNWADGWTNNDTPFSCVYIQSSNGKWNTAVAQDCNAINLPFICKISREIIPPITTPPPGYCLSGWTEFGAHCYYNIKYTAYRSFGEAKLDCEDKNSQLVSILSKAESNYIVEQSVGTVWIGMRKNTEGTYEWLDGSPLDYTNFAASFQSRQNCVYMVPTTGEWYDADCFNMRVSYICKMRRINNEPSTTTAVETTKSSSSSTPFTTSSTTTTSSTSTSSLSPTVSKDSTTAAATTTFSSSLASSTKKDEEVRPPENKLSPGSLAGIVIGILVVVIIVAAIALVVLKKRGVVSAKIPLLDSIFFKDTGEELVRYHSNSQSASIGNLNNPNYS